ncbi:MAG: glutathione peroxidase [Candidatus Eremiobacteraeota bacterium]|nr:glutathione peroxidase [Candidatus Eremiobacteraeota bacterium]
MTTTAEFYDIPLRTIDGTQVSLRDYADDVLLIVNVASKCGLTPQYEGLQRLFDECRVRGLMVLGFPCNQFGEQEPGTNREISTFCSTNYGVTFPLFDKVEVNGPGRHPLYRSLIGDGGDITWNFEKFLIGRSGRSVERFAPKTTPDDPALRERIEDALAE